MNALFFLFSGLFPPCFASRLQLLIARRGEEESREHGCSGKEKERRETSRGERVPPPLRKQLEDREKKVCVRERERQRRFSTSSRRHPAPRGSGDVETLLLSPRSRTLPLESFE